MPNSVQQVQSVARALQDNIGRVIVGKPITLNGYLNGKTTTS